MNKRTIITMAVAGVCATTCGLGLPVSAHAEGSSDIPAYSPQNLKDIATRDVSDEQFSQLDVDAKPGSNVVDTQTQTTFITYHFHVDTPTYGSLSFKPSKSEASGMIILHNADLGYGYQLGSFESGHDVTFSPVSLPAGEYELAISLHDNAEGNFKFDYQPEAEGSKYAADYAYEFETYEDDSYVNGLGKKTGGFGFIYNSVAVDNPLVDESFNTYIDKDIFGFSLDAPQYLRVKIKARPGVRFELTDMSGNVIKVNNAIGSAELVSATVSGNEGGELSVASIDAGLLPAGNYRLNVINEKKGNGGSPYWVNYDILPSAFADIAWDTPHLDDINWTANTGVSKGWTEQDGSLTFRPYIQVARNDMAAFLYRLAGSPEYEPTDADRSYFSDIDESTPHYKEVLWLASKGISTGFVEADGSRTYRPYQTVARNDMSAFLYRLAGKPEFTPSDADMQRFSDIDQNTPHCNEVWWLANTGVSEGFKGNEGASYRPYSDIARCDMAAFLHRMSDKGLV